MNGERFSESDLQAVFVDEESSVDISSDSEFQIVIDEDDSSAEFEAEIGLLAEFQTDETQSSFGEYIEVTTDDYERLLHKPAINSVMLIGNKTGEELYLQELMDEISADDIIHITNGV